MDVIDSMLFSTETPMFAAVAATGAVAAATPKSCTDLDVSGMELTNKIIVQYFGDVCKAVMPKCVIREILKSYWLLDYCLSKSQIILITFMGF